MKQKEKIAQEININIMQEASPFSLSEKVWSLVLGNPTSLWGVWILSCNSIFSHWMIPQLQIDDATLYIFIYRKITRSEFINQIITFDKQFQANLQTNLLIPKYEIYAWVTFYIFQD